MLLQSRLGVERQITVDALKGHPLMHRMNVLLQRGRAFERPIADMTLDQLPCMGANVTRQVSRPRILFPTKLAFQVKRSIRSKVRGHDMSPQVAQCLKLMRTNRTFVLSNAVDLLVSVQLVNILERRIANIAFGRSLV
jgi:hypothetical protein